MKHLFKEKLVLFSFFGERYLEVSKIMSNESGSFCFGSFPIVNHCSPLFNTYLPIFTIVYHCCRIWEVKLVCKFFFQSSLKNFFHIAKNISAHVTFSV